MKRALFFTLGLTMVLCFGLQGALAGSLTTSIKASDEEISFAEAYWTKARMQTTEPIPWYDEEADLGASANMGFAEDAPVGPPARVAGGLPGDFRSKPVVYEDESFAEEQGSDFADFGTKDIFDDSYVNQKTPLWKQFPYKAIGRLFSNAGSCSASMISKNGIIVTAAHCCYDRSKKRWNTNFNFVPAYRNGTAPYGQYPYSRARVLTAWITKGGRDNDVCVIRLKSNPVGKTGYLGRSWNYSNVQHHFAFGYPGNFQSGKYLIECSAESYINCGNNKVNAMGCSMTYGSSGGPWIRQFEKFKSGAMNYVNGVVSGWDGSCTGGFGKSFNAGRFTSNNIVPLCNAEGC